MARYGKAAGKSVKSAVHREKTGTLKSGKGGKGGTVKSRKQAIAIGLSEARKKGAKVLKKPARRSHPKTHLWFSLRPIKSKGETSALCQPSRIDSSEAVGKLSYERES